MDISSFIKKPVLSIVLSILVVIAGVLGYFTLPVEQYPDIAPPTVNVSTNYYGANARTLIKAVVSPLEEAINGVENMLYMQSSAFNNGQVSINVVFKQGTDPDMAAVLVQNRVATALAQLPNEVKTFGVTTAKQQNSMLHMFGITSMDDKFDQEWLGNFVNINIKPQILRIAGVGKVEMLGTVYSMRVWMDPMKMKQYGLVPQDVIAAINSQNLESGTGTIGEGSAEAFQYTMTYTGRLASIEEFEEIIIRASKEFGLLKLKDVAMVELGIESYTFNGKQDGHPSVMTIVYQAPGSNARMVNEQIESLFKDLEKSDLPSGVEITSLYNTNEFLNASIHEVYKTLFEAIFLVILIVLIFLQDIRSTFIPFVGIMVSLIGTFAFMLIAGFSLNLITLFALVLVIGTVVDDSIVVVEAVHAKFDAGYTSSLKATQDAMKEITTAVITSSLVFMAVFIPVSFMSGTSGEFYREFGLTMAVAVGISAFNALTTIPALCALMLKRKDSTGNSLKARYIRWFDAKFEKMEGRYEKGIRKFLKLPVATWVIIIASSVVLGYLMVNMKKGLVPEEDQGLVLVEISTAPGSSLATTGAVLDKVVSAIDSIPEISHISSTAGFGFVAGATSSAGIAVIKLKPWEERTSWKQGYQMVMYKIYLATQHIDDAVMVMPFSLPMIPGYGTSNAIDLQLQDKMGGDLTEHFEAMNEFVAKLNECPEIAGGAMTAYNLNFPQWQVTVDVPACMSAGITPAEVLSVLSTYFGGAYISDINLYNKIFKVMVQANPNERADENSLSNMYVRLPEGKMAPLSNFVNLTRIYGCEAMRRFNLFNAINVSVTPAPGRSSGEAINAIKKVADESLPSQYGVDFAGMAREQSGKDQLLMILGLCVFIIYLLLAALYESFIIPFSILLTVPVGLMASYLASYLLGLENNIYLQTGVIMLIGLISKTGILITEFAVQKHEAGMSIVDSAIAAAAARLRPILMTAGTMVFGLLPLVVATGVGANGSRALGLGSVVGMTFGVVGLLLFVPVLYIFFQNLQDKFSARRASSSTGDGDENKILEETK